MKLIACANCGNAVKTYPSNIGHTARKYCSATCRSAGALAWRKERAVKCADILRAKTMTRKELALACGVSTGTLYHLLAEFKLKTPRTQTQKLERHPAWKGDKAKYGALHLRVVAERGKATVCVVCGAADRRIDYANLSGDLARTSDYVGLCRSCHARFDSARKLVRHVRVLAEAFEKIPALPAEYVQSIVEPAYVDLGALVLFLRAKVAA